MLDDLKFTLRQLRKSPGFTVVAVLTLALGIGANTAVFSLVNAFLLRPLPYPHAERLVMVWEQLRVLGLDRFRAPIGDFVDYRKDNHVFEDMAAIENEHFVLKEGEFPERVFGLRVTANLFAMMGMRPAMGRALEDGDNHPGHEHVAVLSDAVWRGRFGADPSVVGRAVVLDGASYEVVGVTPRDLRFSVGYPRTPEVWVPLPMVADPERRTGNLEMVARLREGLPLSRAQADMNTVAAQLEKQYHIQMGPHGEDSGYGIAVVPLREELVGDLRQSLLLMWGAAGLILLIACVNVANLLLAQGVSREREFAILLSLGASGSRLLRLLVMQAVALAALGGLAGIGVATGLSRLLLHWSPYGITRQFGAGVDVRVAAVAAGAVFAAILLSGMLPAFGILRRGHAMRIQASKQQVMGERGGNRLRQALVVSETALSVALVIAAGLLIHSFLLLRSTPLGFNAQGLLTAETLLTPAYATSDERAAFYGALLQRISGMPNVESAAASTMLAVSDRPAHDPFSIEGRPWQAFGADRVPQFTNDQAVSTKYFRTMQIPLKRGRLFDESDRVGSQLVAVVNETMVRGFWPNENPIGKHFLLGAPRPGAAWLTVVGVVGDVRTGGANSVVVPEFYTPFAQGLNDSMALLVRTKTGDPATVLNEIRTAVAAMDTGIPLHDVETYDEILAEALGPRRYEMLLLASFGGLALLLAAIGLYGVVSYSVAQRTQEIGLRMAFGASSGDVMSLVVRQALQLAGLGLAGGLALAMGFRQALSAMLFGIPFLDVPTYTSVIAVLLVVVLAAASIPARRAAMVDPMEALRNE